MNLGPSLTLRTVAGWNPENYTWSYPMGGFAWDYGTSICSPSFTSLIKTVALTQGWVSDVRNLFLTRHVRNCQKGWILPVTDVSNCQKVTVMSETFHAYQINVIWYLQLPFNYYGVYSFTHHFLTTLKTKTKNKNTFFSKKKISISFF